MRFNYNNPLEHKETQKHLLIVKYGSEIQTHAKDCVIRSISIACEIPYWEVQKELQKRTKAWREKSWSRKAKYFMPNKELGMNGVPKESYEPYLFSLGWKWKPTMFIGSGCKVHLKASELPKERLICHVSKHLVAVIDGVIHDTNDCSRRGTRCVYGYYYKEEK